MRKSNRGRGGWCASIFGLFLGVAGCSPSAARRTPVVQASPTEAPPAPDRAAAPSAVPATPAEIAPPDPPGLVTFLGDGTLLVAGTRSLLAWSPVGSSGRSRHFALPEGQPTLVTSPAHAGVVIALPARVLVLTTPDLTLAHDGAGAALTGVPAVHLEGERVLLTQSGSKLVRLDTRGAPAGASVETVMPLLDGKRFSVTFVASAPDGSDRASALFYDAERGSVLGPGLPFRLYSPTAPRAGHSGRVGFSIEGQEVLRWDLEKAKVERRGTVRCGADRELGNPTPSPSSDLLAVTCGDDLIVLDGKTLKSRRRIPRVVPGCDQGPSLSGRVLPDGKTLQLEGCGGIAKLDLGSGKYTCGDSEGVMGAPYLDAPPAPGAPVRAPVARRSVPACSKSVDEQPYSLGSTGRYQVVYGERMRVVHGAAVLELEPDSQVPVLSPDETLLAYARADHVVVRGLPDGKVRALLRHDAP